jgi:hypothetical protein
VIFWAGFALGFAAAFALVWALAPGEHFWRRRRNFGVRRR